MNGNTGMTSNSITFHENETAG